MKRRNPRRANRNLSPRYRSRLRPWSCHAINSVKSFHKKLKHSNVYIDELSKKEVTNDEMSDIMTDNGGCHHCRICNHTFGTRSTQHWIPQWLSHRQSKKHQNNRSQLLQNMKNGKASIRRHSLTDSSDLSSSFEIEEEESTTDDDADDDDETDESDKMELIVKKPKKRLKLRLNKSKQKNRYKVKCPYCNASNIIQIPSQNFQFKNSHCISSLCNKEYWVHISSLPQPIVTKEYPFTTSYKKRKQQNISTQKRKKEKLTKNVYYDDDTQYCYKIANIDHDHNNDINDDKIHSFTDYTPYTNKMSHIQIMERCSRSICSDFISGDSHCWEAIPMILPGNIRMAQIGYTFVCVWCSKEICFVDIAIEHQNDNNNNNIAHQSRDIEWTLLCKWKLSENVSIQSVDGPSYSRVPSSLNDLRIKDRIMASDGTNWLEGWIEKMDTNKVLVHFKGWNARWDRWYNIKSGMLKTINEYRKEKKLHSATRNEEIYHIMKHKYPLFVATTLYETAINKHYHKNKNNNKIIDAEIVMMHDKNEEFMAVHGLPIYNKNDLILSPPLFYETYSIHTDLNESIIELVLKCFGHLSLALSNPDDIRLIYRYCHSKIDQVFFALYCLKKPDRVSAYLKLLKYNDDNNSV